jgi:hypothetical protein
MDGSMRCPCSLTEAAKSFLGDEVGDFRESIDKLKHRGRTVINRSRAERAVGWI